MEARKVTFTAKPGTFRDSVRAYKKYKEEKEQRQLTRCLTLCEACIDSAEREQARPEVKPIQTRMLPDMPLEEDFPDMDKELYTPEEAYELTMKDIKAVYDKEYEITGISKTKPRMRHLINVKEPHFLCFRACGNRFSVAKGGHNSVFVTK